MEVDRAEGGKDRVEIADVTFGDAGHGRPDIFAVDALIEQAVQLTPHALFETPIAVGVLHRSPLRGQRPDENGDAWCVERVRGLIVVPGRDDALLDAAKREVAHPRIDRHTDVGVRRDLSGGWRIVRAQPHRVGKQFPPEPKVGHRDGRELDNWVHSSAFVTWMTVERDWYP